MAWSNSKAFLAWLTDVINNTTAMDLNSDTLKCALYNNTTAPDQTVASAVTAYNTGQWVVANEVSDGTNWDAGGEPLTGVASGFASNVYTLDAVDTPQGGASCTLASVYGALVLDDSIATPVAKQGISFHYFGGIQGVTAGSFTVVYHPSGIVQLTL
jgi:hypothetical protein